MTRLLFISTLLSSCFYYATAQSQCKQGQCISIHDCASLRKLAMNASQANKKILQDAFCGFIGIEPQVCCPLPSACLTPDGMQGSCIDVYTCPHLLKLLQPPVSQDATNFVRKSICRGDHQYRVCCGPDSEGVPTSTATTTMSVQPPVTPNSGGEVPIGEGQCPLTAFPPDPSSRCCGIDASAGGNRIVGGTAAEIDEYPWLALIEYVKNQTIKLLCGGVLISGKYVMTASHCVVGPVLNAGKPVRVRLGEHDTNNTGADCVEVAGGGIDCNEGTTFVPIETIIPHPEYNPTAPLRRHDIALLRLTRTVGFTDFIRPICLPSTDFTNAPQDEVRLHVAGWGAVSDIQSSSNTKQKVELPFVSLQTCQPSYDVPSRRVKLWDGQICAGGVLGKDSCKGDSGGPLMREQGKQFELVGIVSFGPTPCGLENVPGVYTKVYQYLPWITSQITA